MQPPEPPAGPEQPAAEKPAELPAADGPGAPAGPAAEPKKAHQIASYFGPGTPETLRICRFFNSMTESVATPHPPYPSQLEKITL